MRKNGYLCGANGSVWKPGLSLRKNIGGYNINGSPIKALKKLLEKQENNQPFHYVVSTGYGHAPFDHSKWKRYESKLDTVNVPGFLPNNIYSQKRLLAVNYEVEQFDSMIHGLIHYLKKNNLYDNTVIIVSSDNGSTLGGHSKGNGAYRPGCRIPLAIHWPGGIIGPGRVDDNLVSQMDLSKTILDLANITPSPSMTEGKTLLPIFRNETTNQELTYPREEIYLGFERHIFN